MVNGLRNAFMFKNCQHRSFTANLILERHSIILSSSSSLCSSSHSLVTARLLIYATICDASDSKQISERHKEVVLKCFSTIPFISQQNLSQILTSESLLLPWDFCLGRSFILLPLLVRYKQVRHISVVNKGRWGVRDIVAKAAGPGGDRNAVDVWSRRRG